MGLMDAVVAYLASQKLVLVAAESCTAGLVTAELAQVPGSGQVLEAGLTVYSPEAKQRLLGVAAETIDRWGLTSEAVAREMALGALGLSPASVAVADTGDRKSTRLNSSHVAISYAVFCLKKKNEQ